METIPRARASTAKPRRRKELRYFERRLLEERRAVLRHFEAASETLLNTARAAGGDVSQFAFHLADEGTDAMEREKAFYFASQEGRLLWEIDEALRRLYHMPRTFGLCQRCGDEITFERLDIVPQARFCLACMQRAEGAPPGGRASA